MAGVQHDDRLCGFQLGQNRIQLIIRDVRNPFSPPVSRHNSFIQLILGFISIQILHLGPMPRVMDIHHIFRTGLFHDAIQGRKHASSRSLLILNDADMVFSKSIAGNQNLMHQINVIFRSRKSRQHLVFADSDE